MTMAKLYEAYMDEPDERFCDLLREMATIEGEITPSSRTPLFGSDTSKDRRPTGDDYELLVGAIIKALSKKESYMMPPPQVTLTPATFDAIVERITARAAPDNPLIAYISVDAAQSVADHLDRVIETTCPIQLIGEWRQVRDALQAIANDTDQIRTHP